MLPELAGREVSELAGYQSFHHSIVHGWADLPDRFVRAVRMNPVGQQYHEKSLLRVDPQRRAREAEMPVRAARKVAATGGWITVETTHYIIGSVVGPHPFPMIVRDFQRIIGDEAREQMQKVEGRLPDMCVACVGGGSNSMGLFYPFVNDESVKMIGVEAAGLGIDTGKHGATLGHGGVGILHGMKSYLLFNEDGQVDEAHSISAGLDYPGVGCEHSYYRETGRAEYASITDEEALEGFKLLSQAEGIIPALESAHAIAHVAKLAPKMKKDEIILICLSGRGDKDVNQVADFLEGKL